MVADTKTPLITRLSLHFKLLTLFPGHLDHDLIPVPRYDSNRLQTDCKAVQLEKLESPPMELQT